MAQFIVETKEKNSYWYHHSSHASEYAATAYADRSKGVNPQRSYRVVDERGNVRYIV
jgi:hypothetical protein